MNNKSPTPIISIIVPVYNVDKYLQKCLESIRLQTFQDWECILIDDGSFDKSGEICDEFSKIDSRFKVIHQVNSGVSKARNVGLDIATGDWIGFVDSDDWIEPNMYEYLYRDAIKFDSDCVICGFWGQHKKRIRKSCNSNQALNILFSKETFGGFSFLRLLSSEKVKTIRFDESIPYMEDIKFFYEVFKECKKIYWDNKELYHYEQRDDSVTNKYGLTKEAEIAYNTINSLIVDESNCFRRNIMKAFNNSFLLNLSISYLQKKDLNNEKFLILRTRLKRNCISILFTPYITVRRKIFFIIITHRFLSECYIKFRFRSV